MSLLLNAPRISPDVPAAAGGAIVAAGDAYFQRVSNADARDFTDPDTLYAFFSAQMQDTRGRLGQMVTNQEERNKRVQTIQTASATLAGFQEKPIKPSDPKWNEFISACKDLKAALVPGTKEHEEISKTIDAAIGSGAGMEGPFSSYSAAAAQAHGSGIAQVFDSQGNLVTQTAIPPADGKYFVKPKETEVSAEAIKAMVSKAKAQTDGLQTETTMSMIRIQSLVDSCTQITNLCSTILKKLSDAQNTIIGNIR